MKIAIGSDHAGYECKTIVGEWLISQGYEVADFGTHSKDAVDYPDFSHPVAKAITEGECTLGVLVCGSANGVAMAANKHEGIRAGVCWIPEIASLARQHNNANVCCIPARYVEDEEAKSIIEAFVNAEFEGGRHARRVGKIAHHP